MKINPRRPLHDDGPMESDNDFVLNNIEVAVELLEEHMYDVEKVYPEDRCKDTKYWYFIDHSDCVLCGKSYEEHTRMYTPRPCLYKDRHAFHEFACGVHF